ncbi:MAG: 50S ribosomal protein L29 [Candidatus Methylacidiphilales bacterium]
MKIQDVTAMSDAEMANKVQDLRHERLNLRIQQQSGQLERPSRLYEIRKTIARIETVKSQRRLKADGQK